MIKKPILLYIIFTVLVVLWCAGILVAPVLKHAGYSYSADVIYSFLSRVCHQNDLRSFHIDGEKLGVCIRCSAVYFGFLVGLLFMPLSGALKRMRVPNTTLLLIAILPMVVDVVLNDIGLLTSTPITRMATGALFGVVMPCWIIPLFIEAYLLLVQRKKIHSSDSGVITYDRETQ